MLVRTDGGANFISGEKKVLNDEGLLTLMCEVQAVINGRPITKARRLRSAFPLSLVSTTTRSCVTTRCFPKGRQLPSTKVAPDPIFGGSVLETLV